MLEDLFASEADLFFIVVVIVNIALGIAGMARTQEKPAGVNRRVSAICLGAWLLSLLASARL